MVPQPQNPLHDVLWRHRPAGYSPSPELHPLVRFIQPVGRWWRKHKLKAGIAASMAIVYTSELWGPSSGQALTFAGYVIFAWTCMSYSRARGYTVLPGLAVSLLFPILMCFPVVFFLMLGGPKKKT